VNSLESPDHYTSGHVFNLHPPPLDYHEPMHAQHHKFVMQVSAGGFSMTLPDAREDDISGIVGRLSLLHGTRGADQD
jgi:adenine C2-methylase RlmN of 23S rRNA A2503 and tRNA A37